ncbi:hypothetical protein M409DRAFT_64254 [Zasmidium cellare ATCC 36951]|uniref:RRM domain-containing protein n=1 Tax=Zasmidium cellare ATCC 36951 TaxID=1080233 RepID=A0A6A6CTZ7_ZASCE|nr:uncharacterized protein M409DRAFT_64254 [Zasmidium cellare ATCC 36951]KAF2170561.1 hypothetical protein M409DRAFT_64254 [Zasmidium cellare ATCC 36951]
MNDPARDSEPPDEPYLRSAPSILSPASPKPLQFPQPTNIPVLENMMDVGFNQTEAHMGDPAMHNTDLRPDAWRDPNDQNNQNNPTDHASSFSTGGDNSNPTKGVDANQTDVAAHSNDTAATQAHDSEPVSISNTISYPADSHPPTDAAPELISADVPQYSFNASAEHAPTTQSTVAQSNEVIFDQSQSAPPQGAVDVQALLDTLQTSIAPTAEANVAPSAEGPTVATTQSPSQSQSQPPIPGADASSPLSASGLGAPPSGLPARPPPQEQPLINPNYVHSQHIRDYHPHAAHPAVSHNRSNSSGHAVDPSSAGYVSGVSTQQPSSAGAQSFQNGQSAGHPTTQHQYTTSATPIESRREFKLAAGETPTTDDQPWTQDIQRKYDHFMEEERRYVNEAKWDQFPPGSRLFVGNLSSEKVTKRDIFHVFHNYGELAQISIKQAYGFVQFLRAEDCQRALQAEQGRQIRDKRIRIKPQKPSNRQQQQQQQQQQSNRRSRSPDHRRNKSGSNVDRYVADRGANGRGREGYRPGYRSPSPRRYRDRYDDRYHRRSRSRSPGYGRDRYRGASPRRSPEDDLPLPRRQPRDVPDVQIIALDQLDRDFLSWVKKAFSARGVRTDILYLSARLNEDSVVRRQIVEGVLAVSKLRRHNQDSSKINLTIFKRTRDSRDVQFEEYDGQDPGICCELVLREKSMQGGPPPQQQYGYGGTQAPPAQYGYQHAAAPPPFVPPTGYPPGYGQPPTPYGAPQPPQPPPGRPPLPPNVDPNNLQSILSTLNQAPPQTPQSATMPYGTPQQVGYPPQPGQQQYPGQQADPYAAMRNNPAFAGATQGAQAPQSHGQPPAAAPPVPPNMQDILARLGTYGGQR